MPRGEVSDGGSGGGESGDAGSIQIHRLCRRAVQRPALRRHPGARDIPADRYILLYLPDSFICHRRLSGRGGGTAQYRVLRRLSGSLPTAYRRPNRALPDGSRGADYARRECGRDRRGYTALIVYLSRC